MLYDAHNIHWPFAKSLLRRAHLLLVHNDDVKAHADKFDIPSVILRDPLPEMIVPDNIDEVSSIHLNDETYIIVPCSMAEDEPLDELFSAIEMVPEALFVVTWFYDRLPSELRSRAPKNLRFTGFLEEPDFNALYAKANAAVVLTTREGTQPSGASEAISLGIPLVVSDIGTTRRLYKDKAVFVNNDAGSIASGVQVALSDYEKWSGLISDLKNDLDSEARSQIDLIKSHLPC
jgi:glycosyltransferase involved in cell wall biosynthesis